MAMVKSILVAKIILSVNILIIFAIIVQAVGGFLYFTFCFFEG